jgi:flagellar motor switch protein FliG
MKKETLKTIATMLGDLHHRQEITMAHRHDPDQKRDDAVYLADIAHARVEVMQELSRLEDAGYVQLVLEQKAYTHPNGARILCDPGVSLELRFTKAQCRMIVEEAK